MISMGIDASLSGTACVVLNDNIMRYHGCYQSKNKGLKRLIELKDYVKESVNNYRPEVICLEGYSFGSKGSAVIQLGELGGVIRVMLHEMGANWIEIPPKQAKKYVSGTGNAKKELVILNVYKRWGMEFETNDEADAFVLAKMGIVLLGGDEKLTQKQQEVIKELSKTIIPRV